MKGLNQISVILLSGFITACVLENGTLESTVKPGTSQAQTEIAYVNFAV